MSHNSKRTLAVTLCVTLISVSGIALPYPLLAPLFIDIAHPVSQFMGLPPKVLLGAILAIYPLGILLGSNVIGAWSDRAGRRKVLLVTMIGAAMGYVLSGIAIMMGDFALFALSRLLTGLCEGNLSVARAIAADLHPAIDRTRAFSLLSATSYAGYLVGPLMGGLLLPLGASLAFWVAAIACTLAVVLIATLLPRDKPVGAGDSNTSLALVKDPRIRPFFLLYLMLMLATNGFYAFYPLWLVEYHDADSMGIAQATVMITTAMIITATLFTMGLKRRMGLALSAMVGMGLFAGALVLLPLSNSHYVAPFVAMGTGIAIYNAMLPSYLSERMNHYGQGQLMGLMTTTFCLGNVLIAMLGSTLALWDTRAVLVLSGTLGLFAMVQFGRHHYHLGTFDCS